MASTATSPVDRRGRKKAETREALTKAALRLALAHGYEQLTVEAITDAADVSVRTFFNYFASKDDALLATDPGGAEAVAAAVVARPAEESPVAALRAVLGQLGDSFEQRKPLWRSRLELVRANPHLWPRLFSSFSAFERALTEAVAARSGCDPDTDLFPGVVAAAVVGAMRVAVTHWHARGEGVALADLLADAFDILASGLTSQDVARFAAPIGASTRPA
jgi:AcrR family transcriptional regulator